MGTAYLALELMMHLLDVQPELYEEPFNLTYRDVVCVAIAGLCHDMGHPMFSHMFEAYVQEVASKHMLAQHPPGYETTPAGAEALRQYQQWTHEHTSVGMFRHMLRVNPGLRSGLVEFGLREEDFVFIEELMCPPEGMDLLLENQDAEWPCRGRPHTHAFLYEIVSNWRSGADVDKFDYFTRDAFYLGLKSTVDVRRYIQSLRVMRDTRSTVATSHAEKTLFTLSPDEKQVDTLRLDAAQTRMNLYRKAYKHKTSVKFDYHMRRVLELMEPHIRIPGEGGRMLTMAQAAVEGDMEAFQYIDDSIIRQMLRTPLPELKPAQDEYHRRFTRREIAVLVGETEVDAAVDTAAVARELVRGYNRRRGAARELVEGEVVVQQVKLGHGMKSADPARNVVFYSSKELQRYLNEDSGKKIDKCPAVVRYDHGVPVPKLYRVLCFFDPQPGAGEASEGCFELLTEVFKEFGEGVGGRLVRVRGVMGCSPARLSKL
mmetsp:Transcript_43635/g.107407  ORF Transcript_43635/g.107407 Transcript_43635/m.107407 type:complete len:487 (-) Transcript_43635:52-1512(-)